MTSATAQTGSQRDGAVVASRDARAARLHERGRQGDRRRARHAPGVHRRARACRRPARTRGRPTSCSGSTTRPNNGGDDDLPGTAFQRSRGISNDTWQNYFGVVGSRRRHRRDRAPRARARRWPRRPAACSTAWRPVTLDAAAGNDPNQNADGTPNPMAKIPVRLRAAWPASAPTSRCARSGRRRTTPPRRRRPPTAARSSRRATAMMRSASGWSRLDASRTAPTRSSSARSSYLLPTRHRRRTPRRRRSSGWKYPDGELAGDAGRPGRARGHRVRRARRHEAGQPARERRSRYASGAGVSVPVPLPRRRPRPSGARSR